MNSNRTQFAWAVIRIIAGASLAVFHGYGKVFGGQLEGFSQAVAGLGFPHPLLFAWAAALSELVGGALVALGLLTRLAGLCAMCTMAVAIYSKVHAGQFAAIELALLYFGPMLGAVLIGGGAFSFDASLFRPRPLPGRRFPA